MTPPEMEAALPPTLDWLARPGAPVIHYKVCSTFDSSPEVGSIGQAIDLGVAHTRATWSPMVVGAPRLQRYQVFGHLFAAAQGQVHRTRCFPLERAVRAHLHLHLAATHAHDGGLPLAALAVKEGDGLPRL